MALADTLRDQFSGTGDPSRRDPALASSDMHRAMGGSDANGSATVTLPAAASVDAGALGRLLGRFTNLDFTRIDGVVANVSAGATADLPGLGSLTAAIEPALALARTIQGPDGLALLDRLRRSPAEPTFGMAGIEASLGELVDLRSSPVVTAILGAVRGLVPVPLEIDATTGRIGDALLTARDLIVMVGSMMAIHTAANDLRDNAAMMDRLLAPQTAEALLAQARLWVDAQGVVDAVTAVADPDDDRAVAAVEARVREVARALGALEDALIRAMGFGEATLLHADPARSADAIDDAAARLRTVSPARIRASAETAAGVLERLLPPPGAPTPIGAAWDAASDLSGRLVTAIAGISTTPLTGPVQRTLGTVTSALHEINQIFAQISGAIRGAFAAVRTAVTAIDLQAIAREVQRFLEPLGAAIDELNQFLQTFKAVIEGVAGQLTTVITTATGFLSEAAGHITGAFDAVANGLRSLGLDQVIEDARGGVQQIADELHRIQLQPYFDTAIEVMDTGADVISMVPLDLLPDSAKQELQGVIQPIQAIDFQTDVVSVLETQLDAILDRIDTDVLGAIDAAFQQVIIALQEIDPRLIIDPLETQYLKFIADVKALDPQALLAPVVAAVESIRREIARIDLQQRVLAPIEAAFDQIVGALDQVDPAALLQPIENQIGAIRQRIIDVTHLDQWAAKVDEIHRTVDGALARIDLSALGPRLDALIDAALASTPSSSQGSLIGSVIATLVDGLGLHARPRSFVATIGWISGDDGVAEIRGLVADADVAIARALATARAYDLQAIAAQLDPGYRRLRAAVEAHPAGSKLRLRIDPMLASVAPLDVLGARGADQSRYLAALDASASRIHAMTSRGVSEVAAASGGLREALHPLAVARTRLLEVAHGVGVDLSGADARGLLAPLLEALRPSRVLALLAPVVGAARDKIREVLVDGVLTPVKDGVAEVTTLIGQLDISVFRTELEALRTQIKAELEAFRPSGLLAPTLGALEDLRQEIVAYDPLAPVKAVLSALRDAIASLENDFKPSKLFHGLVDAYDQILALARGLDVKTLLDPVLSALRDLEAQLDTGLEGAAGAFEHLQAALSSASTGGQLSVSVSAGASA